MNRQNKKESVAALHKETILNGAEKLFLEKGVLETTIANISNESEYSRRTIYAYFESKEDILHHIILKGLEILKEDIIDSITQQKDFIGQFKKICKAMEKYQWNSPQSASSVNQMRSRDMDVNKMPPTVMKIMDVGTQINDLLVDYIEEGKMEGIVRSDVESRKTIYIIWSSISSVLSLVQNKGTFFEEEFSASKESFLEYGYKQIINSILEENMRWE